MAVEVSSIAVSVAVFRGSEALGVNEGGMLGGVCVCECVCLQV